MKMKTVILLGLFAILYDVTHAHWGQGPGHHGHYGWNGPEHSSYTDGSPPWWKRVPGPPRPPGLPDHSWEGPPGYSDDYNGGHGGPNWPWVRTTSTAEYETTVTQELTSPTPSSPQRSSPGLPSPPLPPSIPSTVPSPEAQLRECLIQCPVTSERNPVCGTNGVTYSNIGGLLCAQSCGVDVQLSKSSACSVTVPSKRDIGIDSVLNCMGSCRVSKEFSPVCGTNDVTYANIERLECARRCEVAVDLVKMTSCLKPIDENNELDVLEKNTCIQYCDVKIEYDPVCGSNNVTYINRGHLECSRRCGTNVAFLKKEPCSSSQVSNNPSGLPTQSSTETLSPQPPAPTPIVPSPPILTPTNIPTTQEIMACMQQCPLTSEYNPVCGSDGITYTNPGRLLCSQFCGYDVKVVKFASCTSSKSSNLFECPIMNNPTQEEFKLCLSKCPVPDEKKPVCGTDNFTYKNVLALNCAKSCGYNVAVKNSEACPNTPVDENTTGKTYTKSPAEIEQCIAQCPPIYTNNPVCGTNNVNYLNEQLLQCAQGCGVNVQLKHTGPCADITKVTPGTSPTPTATDPTTDSKDTTERDKTIIDPTILDYLYPKPTSSTGTEPTDSEEYDIDQRYQRRKN